VGASARTAIASIEIETHPRGLTLTGTQPDNVLAAQFSMPHAAAAVAVLATGGQAAFSAAALARDDIAALRDKVTLKPYQPLAPWPNDRPSRVTWIMKDSARHTAEKINARGGADQRCRVHVALREGGILVDPARHALPLEVEGGLAPARFEVVSEAHVEVQRARGVGRLALEGGARLSAEWLVRRLEGQTFDCDPLRAPEGQRGALAEADGGARRRGQLQVNRVVKDPRDPERDERWTEVEPQRRGSVLTDGRRRIRQR
jgi:hypothetical protein